MRLTRTNKEEDFYENEKIEYVVFEEKDIIKGINKLGQLEDIEEELGIDLITLLKALKNGFYLKDGYRNLHYPNEKWSISRIYNKVAFFKGNIEIVLFERYIGKGYRYDWQNREYCPFDEIEKSDITGCWEATTVNFKDYGKTWALSKEELEK